MSFTDLSHYEGMGYDRSNALYVRASLNSFLCIAFFFCLGDKYGGELSVEGTRYAAATCGEARGAC